MDKFSKSEKPKTFASHLLELIKMQQLNEIDVYKAANIDRKLFQKSGILHTTQAAKLLLP